MLRIRDNVTEHTLKEFNELFFDIIHLNSYG